MCRYLLAVSWLYCRSMAEKSMANMGIAGIFSRSLRMILNALYALGDVLRPTGFMRCKPCLNLWLCSATIQGNFFNFFRALLWRRFATSRNERYQNDGTQP